MDNPSDYRLLVPSLEYVLSADNVCIFYNNFALYSQNGNTNFNQTLSFYVCLFANAQVEFGYDNVFDISQIPDWRTTSCSNNDWIPRDFVVS